MATAPYCNVPTVPPGANPKKFKGLQPVPPNATVQQIINITNSNIAALNNILTSLNQFKGPETTTINNNDSGGLFVSGTIAEIEGTRVTKIVRVENPDDPDQFVDIERIESLSMRDRNNGERWNWKRGDE